MNIRKSFTKKNDNTGVYVSYDSIEECPNCKKALAPQNLYGIVHLKNDKETLSVADFCNGCHSLIVSEYEISKKIRRTNSNGTVEYDDKEYKMESLNHSAPVNFKEREFDDKLKKLSPQFVKIYNQALKAEELSLDEIAGLGYRKALEFLIKDFAIYSNPEKKEEIKSTWMMKCIVLFAFLHLVSFGTLKPFIFRHLFTRLHSVKLGLFGKMYPNQYLALIFSSI